MQQRRQRLDRRIGDGVGHDDRLVGVGRPRRQGFRDGELGVECCVQRGLQAGDAVDSAKQAAFVATFRASYSDLATDRDDDSIKAITEDTCALREKGATDDELKEAVKGLAANGTTVPSDEQASRILDMAVAACS